MRDPIVHLEAHEANDRIYLRGLTNIDDWKLLAVFDEQSELEAWLARGIETGWLEAS